MTGREIDSPTLVRTGRLRFDRYVLDLDRGCVYSAGTELDLRPKAFALLRYLIENTGRLVSKDELFAALWPNVTVTDDALVQSVGELRRALGDDGSRLIKTIPRRGYRFEADVAITSPTDALSADPSPQIHEVPIAVGGPGSKSAARDWLRPPRLIFAGVLGLLFVVGVAAWTGFELGWFRSGDQLARVPEARTKPIIAFLPFLNLSGDRARDYFADGLTQDAINALGRFSALTVMSWNAVSSYKARTTNLAQIRKDLAINYLVEGTVNQTGDRVRVTAQLVDAKSGQVLWSARFDEAMNDVFALQDRMAKQVVGALAVRVTQAEQRRVFAKPTSSLEAYDLVLRARPALQRPTRAAMVDARAFLRRAIQLDRNYAAAYSALAESYYIATAMGWAESPTRLLKQAEDMASKALTLSDADVRSRIVLGRVHIFYHRYEQARAEIERAIAINPNDASGLAGRGNILMWLGRADAAIEALEQAQRIDPELNAIDRNALSLAYYLKRRYEAAIEQAEINLRANAGAGFSLVVLAAAYAQRGRAEDTARVIAAINHVDPTFDPREFGTKFLSAADLEHLRDGLRKAGFSIPAKRS